MGDERRERGFRSMFEEHAGTVARYAARRTAAGDVHDVVSETFLVAWRRFDQVPDDALPWLLGTARRVIANRRRSAARRRALDARLVNDALTSRRSPAADVDARLLDAIAALPEAEREALMLVAWDDLDPERAARAAGCSSGAFRMRLHRARGRLRRQLAADQTMSPADPDRCLEDQR